MEKDPIKKDNNSLSNFTDLIKNSWRIGKLTWEQTPWILTLMLISTISIGVLPVFASQALGTLIDTIIKAITLNSIDTVYPALFWFAVFTTLPSLIRVLYRFFDRHLFLRLQDFLDILMLKKRGSFDISQYEDTAFQDKLQRAFNNGNYPIIAVADGQLRNIEIIAGIIVSSIATIAIDWRVFLIVLVTSIPEFWVEIKYGSKLWSINMKNSYEQRRYQDLRRFFTSRTAVIDGKLSQVGNKFLQEIKKILTSFTDEQLSSESWKSSAKLFTSAFSMIGLFIGTTLIVQESIAGAVAIGTVVFMFQTLSRINGWASAMLSNTARILERNLYVTDIFNILDEKPIMVQPVKPIPFELSNAPTITFENVSFAYPSEPTKMILKDINLTIKPGDKLGLVGNNGSGKSTIVRLLLRIHDPVSGKIMVNGIDLRDINTEDWWKYLGVLLQDFTTYNFTVKQSIAISEQENIDQERIEKTAQQSTSVSFIKDLKDTYDHMIGVEFGGIEPSKGQRQKLAIARALYKGTRLLVLDEPTASIDAESTSIIFRELENLDKNTSAILISHNFATIKKADMIVVLKDGEIIEQGTHQELLNLNGNYADAYQKQKSEF
jgi:ABC-type multidrug transport system fused ATPase/permease subunit